MKINLRNKQNNNAYTMIEVVLCMFLVLVLINLSFFGFRSIYASYELNFYSRQLVNDIRYIQQQSIMNPSDLQYNIKFYSKYLPDRNKYQVCRGNLQIKKEVRLPRNIEMYYGGAGQPFGSYCFNPLIRELKYKTSGEIGTNTGTVNLRNTVNNRAIGVIVHRIRVRIGPPSETDS